MRSFRIFSAAISIILISGCAAADGEYAPAMKDIYDDERYQEYQKMLDEGQISEDGYYIDPEYEEYRNELQNRQAETGDILVTFARNDYFSISYSCDPEMNERIDNDTKFFNYEDCIYASVPTVSSTAPSGYVFDRFRIYTFDENGSRIGEIQAEENENGLVLRIPMEKNIKSISVEPLGKYENRILSFSDYYIDTDGKPKELTGKWKVNGDEIFSETFEISANTPYTVQYSYDPKDYYYVSSVPEAASQNSSGGMVYFDSEESSYTVMLRRYIKAEFSDRDSISSISVNGSPVIYGDIVRLRAEDTIELTSENKRICCDGIDASAIEKESGGFRFTYKVPDNVSSLKFRARDWFSKKVTFELDQNLFDYINFLGWFASKEEKLITVKTGDTEVSYKKLKNLPSIEMKESDDLQIIISEDINNTPNLVFEISVNGANPVYIGRSSESRSVILSYDRAENIGITAKHGYVFSTMNIDNGVLDVKYRYYDLRGERKDLTEGQFLEKGMLVEIIVNNIPENYEITGGAVAAGEISGIVEITDKTQSSDFVVNSRNLSD